MMLENGRFRVSISLHSFWLLTIKKVVLETGLPNPIIDKLLLMTFQYAILVRELLNASSGSDFQPRVVS